MNHAHRSPLRPRPITRRHVVFGLAAAVLAGCGGGRGSDDRAEPDDDGPPVLVIGDSLTVGARLWGELEEALAAAGWQAEVVAEDGRAIDWGLARVRERRRVPPVAVVGLGTNPGPSPASFADDVRTMVAELVARGSETVVWIPPGDTADPDRVARADALRAAAGGSLRVSDWPALLAAHPEWVAGDGIHLTAVGYGGLADLIRRELAALPDGPPQ